MDATTLHVLLVVFLATLIRSAFGFGEALFAVPLLALRLSSIMIAGVIVAQDWRKIHLRSTQWLVTATLFGIPLGLALLTSSHQRAVKCRLSSQVRRVTGLKRTTTCAPTFRTAYTPRAVP